MTRFWDERTDGQTDGRSDCTPKPAFAFGDAVKKRCGEYCLSVLISILLEGGFRLFYTCKFHTDLLLNYVKHSSLFL